MSDVADLAEELVEQRIHNVRLSIDSSKKKRERKKAWKYVAEALEHYRRVKEG